MTARQKVEVLALEYHKADRPKGEGEYGCPGVECPGVQRLTDFWFPIVERIERERKLAASEGNEK